MSRHDTPSLIMDPCHHGPVSYAHAGPRYIIQLRWRSPDRRELESLEGTDPSPSSLRPQQSAVDMTDIDRQRREETVNDDALKIQEDAEDLEWCRSSLLDISH